MKENFENTLEKVQGFVAKMNELLTFLQQQSQRDENSDPSKFIDSGLVRRVQSGLRRVLQSPIRGEGARVRYLSQLGIEFNRYGTIDFNSEKFSSLLQKDSQGLQRFY